MCDIIAECILKGINFMSNLGIAGFERYKKDCKEEFKLPTREEMAGYCEDVFYHKPTTEQLEVFHRILIDTEPDLEKALEFCEQTLEKDEKYAEWGNYE